MTSEIKSSKRKIVIPGELLTQENKRTGANIFKENGTIFSSVFGVYYPDSEIVSVVPLNGHYLPRVGDAVIGIVVDETYNGYEIDIGTSTNPFIMKERIRGYLKHHDFVLASIERVDEVNDIDLRIMRTLHTGNLLTFTPVKAPRFIGKNNSMIDTIKKYTASQIYLGMNGRIWAKEGNIELLKKAISLIEEEAHKPHLTTKVEEMLKGDKK